MRKTLSNSDHTEDHNEINDTNLPTFSPQLNLDDNNTDSLPGDQMSFPVIAPRLDLDDEFDNDRTYSYCR